MTSFISIDQNCSPLWDAVPKLAALTQANGVGLHCIEDVDIAFTRRGGAALPPDGPLEIARERFYRGGVSDWGAALFYTDFLGRNPVDLRDLAAYTGWTTAALSRRLDRSVDELYAEFSVSDNHQLVGPSYTADSLYHRSLADIGVDEAAAFVRQLLDHARKDCENRFPAAGARQRIAQWFQQEKKRVDGWLSECSGGRLPDLYERWMKEHLPGTCIKRTSERFALSEKTGAPGTVLGRFLRDYEGTAALYNQAIEETGSGQNSLDVEQGELPFALFFERNGRHLRGNLSLRGGQLRAEEDRWDLGRGGRLPWSQMAGDGVRALVGKALVLVLEVRLGDDGAALALPQHGSQYMPTARRFEALLRADRSSELDVKPVWRVRFNVPEQLRYCETRVCLPPYLVRSFGAAELPASELGNRFEEVRKSAVTELEQAQNKDGRQKLLQQWMPELAGRREAINSRRGELGRNPETRSQAAELWEEVKELDAEILRQMTERLVETVHVSRLDFYDSRGALLPWAVALGGEKLYNQLIQSSEIVAEPPVGER